MKARFWSKGMCGLCPHNCVISEGKSGICKVRKNEEGVLKTLVYGKPVSANIDPIEKKPLYHFLPGTDSFSIGTAGCNLGCPHCQNFEIATASPDKLNSMELPPAEVVRIAKERGCDSISYTYNEPTVFFEYALECARLARKEGLKNVLVTNGYINLEPAREFCQYMDAANIDLKAFNDDFYKICGGRLQPVLDTLKLYSGKIWVEITYLVIDGKNDDITEIGKMAEWISKELGKGVPLHFSRAFPMFEMLDIIPTPERTLQDAKMAAKEHLDYVYVGNTSEASNTYCPSCGALLISRKHYNIISSMKDGQCACRHKIAGEF